MKRTHSLYLTLATLVVIAAAAALTLFLQQAPPAASLDAPATEFSAARAMTHLRAIASAPRPLGSRGHDAARDYIVAQLAKSGVEHEVQTTAVTVDNPRDTPVIARVENVIGRVRGTKSSGAILLAAHYDSVPTGPGASDDAHGVAVLLETARALAAQGRLQNDVILLFSDAEEMGLLGARAFVEQHRWYRDVKIAINFEARGTRGPAVLFETGQDSGWAVEQFGRASSAPSGNSLLPRLYEMLPNKTDLTPIRATGVMGLNFAFFDGFAGYHSQNDTVEALDPRSLQHQGNHALATTLAIGDDALTAAPRRDAIFFDLLGERFFAYSSALVPLLTLACCALFAIALVAGLRRGRLAWGGTLRAAAAAFAVLVTVPVATELLARAVSMVHPDYRYVPAGEPHVVMLYRIAFLVIGIALALVVHGAIAAKANRAERTLGAAFVWLAALGITTVVLPEATYLLTWPLLLLLAPLALAWWRKGEGRAVWQFALLVPALVAATFLFVPWIDWSFIILTIRGASASLLFVTFVFALAASTLAPMRKLGMGMLFAGIVLFAAALSNPAGTDDDPMMTSLEYVSEGDSGRTSWIAQSEPSDAWRASFFKGKVQTDGFTDFIPYNDWKVWRTAAPMVRFASPAVDELSDVTTNGLRTVTLRVRPSRDASAMRVFFADAVPLVAASIDGRAIEAKNLPIARWGATYLAPPRDGFELRFTTRSTAPLRVRAVATSYGLEGIPVATRTADVIPASFGFGPADAVHVGRTFTF
ncbi:MAG TPA: M20/M25/M40 family metallo-hydrolase [Thermoanaerobaculia bacterium]|nr:M20/M25/M40 family metallo-hydrolase [Thermoanaerobaculia bacterium]